MNRYLPVILSCLMSVLISANVGAADNPPSNKAADTGPKTATATAVSKVAATPIPNNVRICTTCHGLYGKASISPYPNLAGQNADYLAVQLRAFRGGQRENAAMVPFVRGLSDDDIRGLSDYFSGLKANKAANGNAALVAQGENLAAYCKACHGMKGKPAASVWPKLSGQQSEYLQIQLLAFKRGKRVSAHMQTVVARFGDREFAALAAYYSQLSPE